MTFKYIQIPEQPNIGAVRYPILTFSIKHAHLYVNVNVRVSVNVHVIKTDIETDVDTAPYNNIAVDTDTIIRRLRYLISLVYSLNPLMTITFSFDRFCSNSHRMLIMVHNNTW
jgi:hypothetical protein